LSLDLLADTQAILWWLTDDARLSPRARELLADPRNRILVSVASIWEAAIKASLKKLDAPDELPGLIVEQGFELLDVRPSHAWAVRGLPLREDHKDPFDRLLVAQAKVERCGLVSSDPGLDGYGVERFW
jgi:PIN domain nuclease of toxin-antitoxin system